MRNRRDRRKLNFGVFHVTARLVCGLPFVCRPSMNLILSGILARAQEKYPARICHFQWMGNHYHLIAAGETKHLSPFYNYLQGEIGKSLKRLTGMYQTKVWAGRPKEQLLATPEDVLRMIVYIYANPSTADLVESISDWPGLSSWKMYRDGSHTYEGHWVRPSKLRKIAPKFDHLKEIKLVKELKQLASSKHRLTIAPNAWKRCFPSSKDWSDEYIYEMISSRLAAHEEEQAKRREEAGITALGRKRLQQQPIDKRYSPKKKERTPYVICGDIELRKDLIASYQAFCEKCREAWQKWKHGKVSQAIFPPGAYRPPMALVGRITWLDE